MPSKGRSFGPQVGFEALDLGFVAYGSGFRGLGFGVGGFGLGVCCYSINELLAKSSDPPSEPSGPWLR